eukprot:jgi/Chlat1/1078/Chrsp110S01571
MAQTALHAAARAGNLEDVQRILAQPGTDVDARDKLNRTPLHLASWSGQLAVVKALLLAGANVSAPAADDVTAFHFAAQKGHLEVAKLLAQAGARPDSKTRKGMTPLHYSAQFGHVELVQYLLRCCENLSTANRHGQTPLDVAKDSQIRQLLVDASQGIFHDEILTRTSTSSRQSPSPMPPGVDGWSHSTQELQQQGQLHSSAPSQGVRTAVATLKRKLPSESASDMSVEREYAKRGPPAAIMLSHLMVD